MQWTVETVSPQGAVLARLEGDTGNMAVLIFESPRRSKILVGECEYHIVDKDGFFRRDVRLISPDGTVELSAAVGWSGRMWWLLPDDKKLYYDYTSEWNNHRVVLRDDIEVMRLLPRHNGNKLAGCEVRGLSEKLLWSVLGFYLMVYDERESLDSASQWSELAQGLALEVAAAAIFDQA